jgi:GGDEF domain-containing protein
MLKKRAGGSAASPQEPRIVNGVIKLRTLWETPASAVLEVMLAYARREEVQSVEQHWTSESLDASFMLKCSVTDFETPVWTLSTGGIVGRPSDKWCHPSGDLGFILNLITSESTGTNLSDLITTSSSKQLIAAPSPPVDQQEQTEHLRAVDLQSSPTVTPPVPQQDSSTSMLQGDLSIARLPSLLQSIRMSKMTGRLELRDKDGQSDVYFDGGNPVHAVQGDSVGDLALIELLSWQTGQFRFHANERTSERSVKNRLDTLLMEGMTFADQSYFLEQNGLNLSCYPIRKKPGLRQKEFEEIVRSGPPVNMSHALNLYHYIDDTVPLIELLRIAPLHKTEWVPLLFNFINTELIVLATQPARSKIRLPENAPSLDMTAADAAIRGCLRSETGIFTPGAFLHFLRQEFLRFEAGGPPFSIVFMEARLVKKGGFSTYLPEAGVRETIQRILSLIRPFETLAHFETFDFILLLPQTEARTAALVAQRLVLSLRTIPKVDWESDYAYWCGIASVPGDGKDAATLIAAALQAKVKAVETKTPVVMFRNLLV